LLALPFAPKALETIANLKLTPAPIRAWAGRQYLDLPAASAILKKLYSGQKIETMVYRENPFMHLLDGTHKPGPDSSQPCSVCLERRISRTRERLYAKYKGATA